MAQIFSGILGTGSYLPEKVLTNEVLSERVDTSHDWIVERTGICERRIASEAETSASMAFEAAKRALEAASVAPEDLGLIIVATCTPDKMFPSTACIVQEKLGAAPCPAFDVSAACSGFVYALSIADQYIRSGTVKHALVVGSEVMSRTLDWTDRTTCVLFGDGSGAVVLGAQEAPGIYSTHLHADGRYGDLLYFPNQGTFKKASSENAALKMQGKEVFKMAVKTLEQIVEETLSHNHFKKSDIDWLVPHQANLRIIQATAKKLEMTMDKVVVTVDKQSNTSSATIPLALDAAVRDGRIQRGHHLLLEAFGGGLTWGSALVKY